MEKQSRRKFVLGSLGVLGAATLTGWIFRRELVANTVFRTSNNPNISATAAPAMDGDVCVLTSQQVEGPFYRPSLERSNIIEDRVGKAMDLKFQVIRYPDCVPIENAVVEIWQSDAEGNYSGYPDQVATDEWDLLMYVVRHGKKYKDEFRTEATEKTTYLRGLQKTDKDGWVSFNTIFPTWYINRIPHIHFKVFVDNKEQITSQFYFEKETQDKIFTELEPYNKRGVCPTTVQNDLATSFTPGKLEGVLLKPIWSDTAPLLATAKIGVKNA